MQHDYFQKKMFWPFDFTPRVKGLSAGKICAAILLHVSFPLIWYAAWPYCEKSLILASVPPLSPPKSFKLKSSLIFFISTGIPVSACKITVKNIDNWLSYCEIEIFDLWAGLKGQRRWLNFWLSYAYLQVVRYNIFGEMSSLHKKPIQLLHYNWLY